MLFNHFWQLQLTLSASGSHVYVFHLMRFCGVYLKLASRIARILPVGDKVLHIDLQAFWPVLSWHHEDCLELATLSHKRMGFVLTEPAQNAKSDHSVMTQVICSILDLHNLPVLILAQKSGYSSRSPTQASAFSELPKSPTYTHRLHLEPTCSWLSELNLIEKKLNVENCSRWERTRRHMTW